jgi:hypothetical protein
MRWTLVASMTTALALAGAGLATASLRPVLRLGTENVVRGSHFKAHELVHVVFTSDVRHVRVLRVNASGSFSAALPTTDRCSSLRIRATGASGDAASIALSRALCPPASSTGTQSTGTASTGTASSGSPPSSSGTTPPPSGGSQPLPDPHGPPTINPSPNG